MSAVVRIVEEPPTPTGYVAAQIVGLSCEAVVEAARQWMERWFVYEAHVAAPEENPDGTWTAHGWRFNRC